MPVLLRLVTQLAHSRAAVTLAPPRAQNEAHYLDDPTRFILLPSIGRRGYDRLIEKQIALQTYS